jgi:ferredoxin-NADP reductase
VIERAGPWQTAKVVDIRPETAHAKTYRLRPERPMQHRAGQHYVVKLTAEDGYSASRSYSVASAPDDSGEFELTVERLDDGEVSTFLHDELQIGDEIEIRGPIGGFFVWDGDTPALLIGGGSGIVPLMAMLRLARATGRADLVRLVVSARAPEDLYYANEVVGPETTLVFTRSAPPDAVRAVGRLNADDVAHALLPDATVYICGSDGFCNAAGDLCVQLGVPTGRIRTERFGPSG